MTEKKEWRAEGLCYGKYWGGGEGSFEATKYSCYTSEEELVDTIVSDIDNGNIDSGMGYESMLGAVMRVTRTITLDFKGKIFINEESKVAIFGDLTEEQSDFLLEVYNGY